MKKNIIVAVLSLIIAMIFGLTSDSIKPAVEKIYCQLAPEECKNETKSNVKTIIPQSIQKESRRSENEQP